MVEKLLLASNSPRRRQLLAGLDIPMEVVRLKDIDETHPSTLSGGDIPLHIARLKMHAYDMELLPGEVLITADTIGARYSGDCLIVHQVFTAVCLRSSVDHREFVCCTDVTFAPLSDQQIDYYISTYRPFDKAGAYGIQEWIGYVGCTRLEGSYFNVMGLPVQKLYQHLQLLKV